MTTEERIEQLLKRSEIELRRISQTAANVGNRPHYPMFILWDDSFSGEAFDEYGEISTRLKRVWPSASRYLAQFSYRVSDGGSLRLFTLPDKREADRNVVLETLAREQGARARETFADMGQWRLYNVVDTSRFLSLAEFQAHYEALYGFQDILEDASRAMLIVLLDDSRNHREVATDIRKFLAQDKHLYDCTVIISNLTRNNSRHEMAELYPIAAGILLLSNNDSFFEKNSSGFSQRSSTFYTGGSFVVSYQSMERPTRDIALQIHHAILDEARQMAASPYAPNDSAWTWNGFLTTDSRRDRRNALCEETVKQWPIQISRDTLEFLPLRSLPPKLPPEGLSGLSYSRLKQYTFRGVLKHLAEEYGGTYIFDENERESAQRRANEMAEKWKASALQSRPLPAFRQLTDEQIDRMVEELDPGTPREGESAKRYLEECVRIQIRQKLLYPRLKAALLELRRQASETMEALLALQDAYRQMIPPSGFQRLGTSYEMSARDFVRESAGRKFLQRICNEGASAQEILDQMLECFRALVVRNQAQFSLPFAEEWMRRLRFDESRDGDRNIYRTISGVLTSEEDAHSHLRGNYPLGSKRLRAFFLHTTDMNGNNPTELYENLKTAFSSDPILQYLNTGYAGTLEAFTLLSCDGENLVV